MQANFELKYVNVSWYDQDTVLSFEESLFPLELDFDNLTERFICNTLIYPEKRLGQLAFRILTGGASIPFFEAADSVRFPLKKIVDKETGNEWWIEANFWKEKERVWESKTHRYAGKSVVVLHSQTCQINIGSSEFTAEQLELYLSDFKSDLWELILDESSYVTGDVRNNKVGGVSLDSIDIVSSVLTHAQQILSNPKSELREIQAVKPRKLVKPVNRTFMEIATRGHNRFLTSRAFDTSYDIAENRYVLFALERINKILTQQIKVSKKKSARSIDSIGKLDERLKSFSSSKLIPKESVRTDLEKIKVSYNLEHLNRLLLEDVKNNFSKDLSDINLEIWFVRIEGEEQDGKGYAAGIRLSESVDWFGSKTQAPYVFLRFTNKRFSELFKIGFEYEIEAEIKYEEEFCEHSGVSHCYTIIGLNSIKKTGGAELELRKKIFQTMKNKAMVHDSNGWMKRLDKRELSEQAREKTSVLNRRRLGEEQYKNANLVYELLVPKQIKLKGILSQLKKMKVKPAATFPNSMTFVQNLDYQAIHSAYKALLNLANLSEEDILVSLEEIEAIGLVNVPKLYERWCLLQIILVLIQRYHYVPTNDWKRALLRIVSSGGHSEYLEFVNFPTKRSIKLSYEPTLGNGKMPDFVMDVSFQKKGEDANHTKRFVMDAKYYSSELMQKLGGISSVINELYKTKNYSEDGRNAVFILHPADKAIPVKVSPQIWGSTSFLGELQMFDWDKRLREKHYHQYGAICANPVLRHNHLDDFQRLIGLFLQYGIEGNEHQNDSDDVTAVNFCIACGSHDLNNITKKNTNSKSRWYVCNECQHFTTYNHCIKCATRIIKNGDYWTYHSQMPMEPLNIKCPACESLF